MIFTDTHTLQSSLLVQLNVLKLYSESVKQSVQVGIGEMDMIESSVLNITWYDLENNQVNFTKEQKSIQVLQSKVSNY